MNRSDFVAIIHKPFSFSSDWIFTRKISFHFACVFFFIPKCLHLFAEPQHLKSSLRFYLDTASMQLSCNAITIKRTLSTTHNYVRTVFLCANLELNRSKMTHKRSFTEFESEHAMRILCTQSCTRCGKWNKQSRIFALPQNCSHMHEKCFSVNESRFSLAIKTTGLMRQ